MRKFAPLRNLLLSLLIVLFAAACGSPQSKILGKWAYKEIPSQIMEFFKDGTFTMTGGKEEPGVSGKWTALDDGRIKVDLQNMFGAKTFFLVFIGEELEGDMGGKARFVRVK